MQVLGGLWPPRNRQNANCISPKELLLAPCQVELSLAGKADLSWLAAVGAHRPDLPVGTGFLRQVGDPRSIRRPDRVGMRPRSRGELCSIAAIGVHDENLPLGQVF